MLPLQGPVHFFCGRVCLVGGSGGSLRDGPPQTDTPLETAPKATNQGALLPDDTWIAWISLSLLPVRRTRTLHMIVTRGRHASRFTTLCGHSTVTRRTLPRPHRVADERPPASPPRLATGCWVGKIHLAHNQTSRGFLEASARKLIPTVTVCMLAPLSACAGPVCRTWHDIR